MAMNGFELVFPMRAVEHYQAIHGKVRQHAQHQRHHEAARPEFPENIAGHVIPLYHPLLETARKADRFADFPGYETEISGNCRGMLQ